MKATAKLSKKVSTVPSIPSGNRMLLLSDDDDDEDEEQTKFEPIEEEST